MKSRKYYLLPLPLVKETIPGMASFKKHDFVKNPANFCKMTKHDLVQFNTEVYYPKCCYLYQFNVYILFN